MIPKLLEEVTDKTEVPLLRWERLGEDSEIGER